MSTFGEHSLISTVNVVRTVISAAAQPTAGKIADVFGRLEVVYLSVLFYAVGTIIQASSNTVGTFCAGAIIYQIGLTVITFLVEVIVADITSLRSRLLWSYIAATPFIINTWVSGNVVQSVLDSTTWRWGIGMWAIIYPALSLPLVVSLLLVAFRAKRRGEPKHSIYRKVGLKQFCISLFWQLGKFKTRWINLFSNELALIARRTRRDRCGAGDRHLCSDPRPFHTCRRAKQHLGPRLHYRAACHRHMSHSSFHRLGTLDGSSSGPLPSAH